MKLLDGYLKRKNGSMSTSSRQTASDSCCESRRQHKYNIDKKSLQKIDVKP